jgi:hypothetical protein
VPLTRAWVGYSAVEAVVTSGQIQGEPSATIGVDPLEAADGPEGWRAGGPSSEERQMSFTAMIRPVMGGFTMKL